MKKIMLFSVLLFLFAVISSQLYAHTSKGTAFDENALWLGEITYLGNPSGYHFWFTPEESHFWYTANHNYHNVYKFEVDNPEEWCGTVLVPDREPYNLVGHTDSVVYYKIIDLTTGEVCPSY